MKTRRIFVSMPADLWQTPAERDVKWGIVKRIEKLGYVTEVFTDPRGTKSLSAAYTWSREGCAVLGVARVTFDGPVAGYTRPIPAEPTAAWFKTDDFKVPFDSWREKLDRRRDVFLGYCSASSVVARKVKAHLVKARALPRDNVVCEAGYFSAAKGKQRTLIVLQQGAKMPADLGGDIYASLPAGDRIDAIKPVLRKFAESL